EEDAHSLETSSSHTVRTFSKLGDFKWNNSDTSVQVGNENSVPYGSFTLGRFRERVIEAFVGI
ncbi:TPA: diguanylate cyclase, partial [Vibrio parahaemolyticus]